LFGFYSIRHEFFFPGLPWSQILGPPLARYVQLHVAGLHVVGCNARLHSDETGGAAPSVRRLRTPASQLPAVVPWPMHAMLTYVGQKKKLKSALALLASCDHDHAATDVGTLRQAPTARIARK
jgi:hypothetical protein